MGRDYMRADSLRGPHGEPVVIHVRRATDHEGETLFGDEERSRLRAVHDADLYRLERRKGFWVGAVVWVPMGAGAVVLLQWLTEVLR